MRFALIADCHIGEERPYEGVVRKLSRYALPFINEIIAELGDSVDFIVQLGDLIEDGDLARSDLANYLAGINAFARAPVPVLHVIGNHEQVHLTLPELCAAINGAATDSPPVAAAAAAQVGALPYYSRMIGGYKLIVLFSKSVAHTDIHIDREQIDWLKTTLALGREPVFVFVHHPLDEQSLAGNIWFEKYPDYCFCEERLELREILESSGRVLAVFGGHVHQNSVSCINGIYYVTVQSLVESIVREGGQIGLASRAYAIVEVSDHAKSDFAKFDDAESNDAEFRIDVNGSDVRARDLKIEVFGRDPLVREIPNLSEMA